MRVVILEREFYLKKVTFEQTPQGSGEASHTDTQGGYSGRAEVQTAGAKTKMGVFVMWAARRPKRLEHSE